MKTLSKIAPWALALALAGPALAQEGPVATSDANTQAADAQIRAYLDEATKPLPAESDDSAPVDGPAALDKKPHGEFGVGVGTNGYREVYASTVVPVGDVGTAAVAVSDTRFKGRFGPQKRQSLSVALDIGGHAAPPEACREEGRLRGDRDPMWVTRMRQGQTLTSSACAPDKDR